MASTMAKLDGFKGSIFVDAYFDEQIAHTTVIQLDLSKVSAMKRNDRSEKTPKANK